VLADVAHGAATVEDEGHESSLISSALVNGTGQTYAAATKDRLLKESDSGAR
jgi:hypothetical protein